jgi:hypothetical protein
MDKREQMLIECQELENFAHSKCESVNDFNVYWRGIIDGYNYFNKNKVKIVQLQHKMSMEDIPFVEDVERGMLKNFVDYLVQQGFLKIERESEMNVVNIKMRMNCLK